MRNNGHFSYFSPYLYRLVMEIAYSGYRENLFLFIPLMWSPLIILWTPQIVSIRVYLIPLHIKLLAVGAREVRVVIL